MRSEKTQEEKLDIDLDKDELYMSNDEIEHKVNISKKNVFLSGLLVVDLFFITHALLECPSDKSVYIITLSVVLLSMVCIYVRLSSIKSEKKEIFQTVEKYLSTIIMIIVLVGNIIAYATLFNVIVLHKPVHSEDYGFGILAAITHLCLFYFDVFTYPFIFIFFNKKITRIILKIKLGGTLFIILYFMLLL